MSTATAYTPEPGSLAHRVATWLCRNRDEELTPRDIATKFDVPVQGLHFSLRDAMDHGWVKRSGTNGSYSAGPRLPQRIGEAPSSHAASTASARPASIRRFNPPDPARVIIKSGVPLPGRTNNPNGSVYRELLLRMKPGDMVELPRVQATAMATAAKKHGIKTAVRMLTPEITGVWRTE